MGTQDLVLTKLGTLALQPKYGCPAHRMATLQCTGATWPYLCVHIPGEALSSLT
jgi:hypothetical protein